MKESYRPNQTIQPEAKPQGGPERPALPQKNALNRAIEQTRDLHKRNGWTFLPFGVAGDVSPVLPSRPLTTIISAPSADHLTEEPKKVDKNQAPHEEGKAPPKVPQSQSESESEARIEQLDHDMGELMEQIGDRRVFFEMLADAMAEKVKRMSKEERERTFEHLKAVNRKRMQDMDPRNANYLRQLVGEPLDPSLSDEKLQRMFELPGSEESPSESKR
jgi:hypothetical protein